MDKTIRWGIKAERRRPVPENKQPGKRKEPKEGEAGKKGKRKWGKDTWECMDKESGRKDGKESRERDGKDDPDDVQTENRTWKPEDFPEKNRKKGGNSQEDLAAKKKAEFVVHKGICLDPVSFQGFAGRIEGVMFGII